MAFILHSSNSITQSGVRTLSLKRFVAFAGFACLFLTAVAFISGWMLGQHVQSLAQQAPNSSIQGNPAEERFAFDRLGDVSGRLLTLESEARSLLKKLTALETLESRLADLKSGKPAVQTSRVNAGKGGAGGQVFAAQACHPGQELAQGSNQEKIMGAEKTLSCLQALLQKVEFAAAKRSVSYMILPTQQPIASDRLGSRFGNRADPFTGRIAFHSGLDFEAPTGAPIHAAGGGRVKNAGWQTELGYMVEIDHGNGLMTRYAHASKLHVKTGDVVTPGQIIAAVGSTGRSTGPHLHFEILHEGRFVDPLHYLNIGNAAPNV